LIVPGILTVAGIYGCVDENAIQMPNSICHELVSLSEVSEWVLSLFWMAFILSIAHDLYYIFDTRDAFASYHGYETTGDVTVMGKQRVYSNLHQPIPIKQSTSLELHGSSSYEEISDNAFGLTPRDML